MQPLSRPWAALGGVGWLSPYFSPILSLGFVGVSLCIPALVWAEDLKTIQQRGQLVVAVKDNLPPLGFRSADGQLQGLEIDIAKRLAQELVGKPDALVLKPVLNQERLRSVLEGRVDIAIARITSTASRSRIVSFSIPYYLDGTALVTKDPTLQTLADLKKQTIAVLKNSSTLGIVRHRLPQSNLVDVESYESARILLETGEVSAFAADASVLSGWVREFPQYRLLTPTLSVEPLCIVIPKGLQYKDLQQKINESLTRWQSEGWLKERTDFWKLP